MLESYFPILLFLGIIEEQFQDADATVFRTDHLHRALRFDRIGKLFKDPLDLLKDSIEPQLAPEPRLHRDDQGSRGIADAHRLGHPGRFVDGLGWRRRRDRGKGTGPSRILRFCS